jgi:hypothetical protein
MSQAESLIWYVTSLLRNAETRNAVAVTHKLSKEIDARGSESVDAELSDCTLMALNYLKRANQRKIGKKS